MPDLSMKQSYDQSKEKFETVSSSEINFRLLMQCFFAAKKVYMENIFKMFYLKVCFHKISEEIDKYRKKSKL